MTAPVQVAPADFDALLELLAGDGEVFRSVSYDPAEIQRLPGIWVRVDGIDTTTPLADQVAAVEVTLHLIAASKPIGKAFADLLPLLDAVVEIVTPTGPAIPVGVTLPGSTKPLPALAVPFTMHTTQET